MHGTTIKKIIDARKIVFVSTRTPPKILFRSSPHSDTLLTLNFNVILPRGILSGVFPYDYPIKILKSFSISPILATCLVHYIFLDMITLMFGED